MELKPKPRSRKVFTQEMDFSLARMVNEYGPQWNLIAIHFQPLTARQCKERYEQLYSTKFISKTMD